MMKTVKILGCRGVPARHGGFETFAEELSLFLASRDWCVTVYCQECGRGEIREEDWRGVHLVRIPVNYSGALGTIVFDWISLWHSLKKEGPNLVLGYNTGAFHLISRLTKTVCLINMDGIEWKREKWSFAERCWLYCNECIGAWSANHLIADHPEIKKHLLRHTPSSKITMIPYGARNLEHGDTVPLIRYGVSEHPYCLIVARPEPENSILEIVQAFTARSRGLNLLVLGDLFPDENPYHQGIMGVANEEVVFPGAIYDKDVIDCLRFHAKLYIHGHRVGGTNPSLVEALGAGTPILAYDNCFNRWVAGEGSTYFSCVEECKEALDYLLANPDRLSEMKRASKKRFFEAFTWKTVLNEYEKLLLEWQKDMQKRNA